MATSTVWSSGGRQRRTVAVIGVMLLALTLVVGRPGAAEGQTSSAPACPPVLPLADVTAGMRGTGWTVAQGTVPVPFGVTVVGVLTDAIAPGIPLIVVELAGPEIDRVGGAWGGMSGSPVVVDGRLLGAVAYGFSAAPSKLAGVTPAASMIEVPTRARAEAAAQEIPLPDELRARAAAGPLTTAQAVAMRPLPLPMTVAGARGRGLEQLERRLTATHPGVTVVDAGAAAAPTAPARPVVAGGNLAVSLTTGDVTAVAVGTVTTVCSDRVLGFGHPLLFQGAANFGLHGADVVRVVDDRTFGPYKLANPGAVAGVIDHDRLAGVAGRLGPAPDGLVVRSSIRNLDEGRTFTGRSDGYLPEFADTIVLLHLLTNYEVKAFDDPSVAGTAEVDWTLRGTRAGGRSFVMQRTDRFAGDGDLSWVASWPVASAIAQLRANRYEAITIEEVVYTARAGTPYRSYELDAAGIELTVAGVPVTPAPGEPLVLTAGSDLEARVPVRAYRGDLRTVTLRMRVPADASGSGELAVFGGASAASDDCFDGCPAPAAGNLDALLELLADAPRGDDLVAELRTFTPSGVPQPAATTTSRLDGVVKGQAWIPVVVGEGGAPCGPEAVPPFVDVAPDSIHRAAIACAASRGLTRGVASDPPRFAPERTVRRDAAASLLVRTLEGVEHVLPQVPATHRFRDLAGNPHRDAIERLAAAGIVQGVTDETYGPSRTLTRAQFASLLAAALRRVEGSTPPAQAGGHSDVAGGPHAQAIGVVTAAGLMTGRPDGTFAPGAGTRRDQAATVFVRLYDRLATPAG